MMASEEGVPVDLYIYDLTHGLASVLSPAIIGKQIEGVWHTSIVVFDREYFYGAGGVTWCAPGSTQLGAPHQVERLGATFLPFPVFNEYIQGLATTSYTGAAYSLLEHNCNHFSEEVAQFVCGARVPKHILAQPDALPPPLRAALAAALGALAPAAAPAAARRDSPDYDALNSQIEEARATSAQLEARRSTLAEKLARKERRREKKRKKQRDLDAALGRAHLSDDEMAEAVEAATMEAVVGEVGEAREVREAARAGPSSRDLEAEVDQRALAEQRRRERHPPILFTDIDGAEEFEALAKELEGVELSEEERQGLEELRQYLVQGEGSWVLGDPALALLGRVLGDDEAAAAGEARVRALRALAAAARRDDVALLLHQDRRAHCLMAFAARVEEARVSGAERLALAQFLANLSAHAAAAEWPLYVSEWAGGRCNLRVTTKVCVHAVLAADAALRDAGTALLYNVATRERLGLCAALRRPLKPGTMFKVFDEVSVELCMAALQLVAWAPPEEPLWRALTALACLVHHSHDVPQLVAMVGPDPSAFRGTSPRIDEQIDIIMQKVARVAS